MVEEDRTVEQSDRLPSKAAGVGYGLVAWILAWVGIVGLAAYHAATSGVEDPVEAIEFTVQGQAGFTFEGIAQRFDIAEPGIVEILLWSFYSAHGVAVSVAVEGQTVSVELLEVWAIVMESSELLYLATPGVVLFLCGFAIAKSAGATTPEMGAKAGAFVAIGYTSLFLIGYPIATIGGPTGAISIGPSLVDVFVRGIGYPVIAGGLGGVVAGSLSG